MSNTKAHLMILLAFSSVILFWGLDKGSLVDWDEATHAQVAGRMLQDNDWFALHPKGTVWGNIWLHKPPLYFWTLVIFYKIFGVTTLASRLPSALFGVGCVIVTYKLGKGLFNERTGFLASLILLTSPQFINKARMSMLDVPVTFFISLSLLYFLLSKKDDRYWLLFGVSLALAVMTKQVVGLFPMAIIFVYSVLTKDWVIKRENIARVILPFLVIALPWHILQYYINGEDFINSYLLHQVIERGSRVIEDHGYGAFYYFHVILKGFSPWSYILPIALLYTLTDVLDKGGKSNILVLTWVAVIIGTFTFAQSKLPWYIIPAYPAMATCVAFFLDRLIEWKKGFVILVIVLLLIAIDLPEALDCNHTNAFLGKHLKGNVLVHESVRETPSTVFYLDGERVSTEELEERLERSKVICAIDKTEYSRIAKSDYNVLYHGQPLVFTNDLDIGGFIDNTPSYQTKCYPYMPENLYV